MPHSRPYWQTAVSPRRPASLGVMVLQQLSQECLPVYGRSSVLQNCRTVCLCPIAFVLGKAILRILSVKFQQIVVSRHLCQNRSGCNRCRMGIAFHHGFCGNRKLRHPVSVNQDVIRLHRQASNRSRKWRGRSTRNLGLSLWQALSAAHV